MQCTHIKADGIRCAAPALRNQKFCYFHHHNADHRPRRQVRMLDIPLPEDAASIQVGIYNVMLAIIDRRIDERRAQQLLWALQIAASQSEKLPFENSVRQSRVVTELPEYERVQLETAEADRQYIANAHADAAARAAAQTTTQVASAQPQSEQPVTGKKAPAKQTPIADAKQTDTEARPTMSPEQIDNLIDRACNGDWRSAKKLFREAGLMPAS